MGFAGWVKTDELEAAGGFMPFAIVGGLAAGSFQALLLRLLEH